MPTGKVSVFLGISALSVIKSGAGRIAGVAKEVGGAPQQLDAGL